MQTIRDSTTLVGWLEQGQLASDLSAEIQATLAHLRDLTDGRPKTKAKGAVSLKLSLEVEDGTVRIEASIESKRPKPVRAGSMAWVLPDGTLSLQHPRQIDMFPQAVRARAVDA